MKRLRPITMDSAGQRRGPREDTGEFCTSWDLGERDPVRASRGGAFFAIAARRLLIAVLLALTVARPAGAGEDKIQMNDLPAAVQKAVQQEEAKGATIKNIVAEKESGQTVYEVETIVSGHTRDLIFDATGKIVESEEEVSIDAVPAPAKAAFEASGKVVKVETVTKGANVTYEAQVEKNGKKSEVAVDALGKRVKP